MHRERARVVIGMPPFIRMGEDCFRLKLQEQLAHPPRQCGQVQRCRLVDHVQPHQPRRATADQLQSPSQFFPPRLRIGFPRSKSGPLRVGEVGRGAVGHVSNDHVLDHLMLASAPMISSSGWAATISTGSEKRKLARRA